jgi:protein containing von willebrand factor
MAETLADSGNGNYAYIDNLTETKKVLVNEFGGTLFTVAKDVKLQIEFNPKYVKQYKLLGYENRMLANEDFTNDKKDAGEVGAGHSVTAIYEIVPSDGKVTSSLRYQDSQLNEIGKGNEVAFLKIRYKDPKEANAASREVVEPLVFDLKQLSQASDDFRFAAAVTEFGLLLRDSEHKADASYDQVVELAKNAFGRDEEGYRKEFVRLVESAKLMKR